MFDKEEILHRIIGVVNKTAPDSEVYLYGSRARGNESKQSDWDLLILMNRPEIPFELETQFMDDFYDLELETGEIISPLLYSKDIWKSNYSLTPFFENVINDGIRLK